VVALRIPGVTIVGPGGEFLRYCRNEGAESLAAVEEFLAKPRLRQELSRLGRQRVTKAFSPAAIAQRTAEFCEQLYRC